MKALVLYGSSAKDSDLFYASGFFCSNPFLYIGHGRTKAIITCPMEKARALKESKATAVYSYSDFRKNAALSDIILSYLRRRNIGEVKVPLGFPYALGRKLSRKIRVKAEQIGIGREVKTGKELEAILEAQHAAESAMHVARDMIKSALVNSEKLLYYGGMCLTSEWVKRELVLEFARHGCMSDEPTVVCGDSCLNVHDTGSGALKANESIIIDIFPRSSSARYYSDMTRTFVKGKASPELKRMYSAVKIMKQYAWMNMRQGQSLEDYRKGCIECFESLDFKTGLKDGVMQGFIHGIGHGVGLDIHEYPQGNDKVKTGNVIAVEPGLYYKGIGGVRLEDIVHITSNGSENLTCFPEELEI